MKLLCHDVSCAGHGLPAGSNPAGECRFCNQPLVDSYGVLLIENPESLAPVRTDMVAVGICSVHDHVWEGAIIFAQEELRGSCSRCGLMIALPFGPLG